LRIDQLDLRGSDLRQPLAVGFIVAGTLLLLRESGLWFSDRLVWPVTLAGFGIAVLWARSGDEERARLKGAAARLPGRPFDVFGPQSVLRLVVGGALVFAGLGFFLATNDALAAARQVFIVVAVAGLGLILGPWIHRLVGELRDERRERIRSEERAEMAAHLHDSVLQTLALIQRNADRPRELVALARRQERELRSWLYSGRSNGLAAGTLGVEVTAMANEVEQLHEVEVDVVTVGDCPVDAHVSALLLAAREALVNAAKHSGVHEVSLYVEAEDDCVNAFVRDRGVGFDVDTIAADRRGITESIHQRMARHGGTAAITSVAGEGTEVALEVKRA
jgi:signal transduction histidine kinase